MHSTQSRIFLRCYIIIITIIEEDIFNIIIIDIPNIDLHLEIYDDETNE